MEAVRYSTVFGILKTLYLCTSQNNLAFTYAIHPNITNSSDSLRLRQVITNLFGKAERCVAQVLCGISMLIKIADLHQGHQELKWDFSEPFA